MDINQILIWLIVLLATFYLIALISLPKKSSGKIWMMLFVGNFVLHFLSIYFTEFSSELIEINLNPFFSANYGPLLYLYFKAFNSDNKGTNKYQFLYFFPSILLLVWCSFSTLKFETQSILSLIILTFNFIFIFTILKHYFKSQDMYTLAEKKWLLSLVGLFSALLIIVLMNQIFSIHQTTTLQNKATTLIFVLSILLVGSFLYFSIVTPEIYRSFKSKYLGSGLDQDQSFVLSQSIKDYLIQDEKFVESDISLDSLANKLNTSTKNISQAINQNFGTNFYDYLNSLRIEKAKLMLLNSINENMAIKNIMFDCGFNNKVSFNKAFKNRTGMTPTEFKNKHLKKGKHSS